LVESKDYPHPVDCTQSQTSTVQYSVSLLSESGAPQNEGIDSDYDPWAPAVSEGSHSRRFGPKRKAWKRWLQNSGSTWTRLAEDDGTRLVDDDYENTPVLEKTGRSDDDSETRGIFGARSTRKTSIKARSLKKRDVQAQSNKRKNKTARFFKRIRKDKKEKDCLTKESNLSDTDDEEHILPEKAAQSPTTEVVSDPSEDTSPEYSLLLAQEMFENASRVLDKELLDISSLETLSRMATGIGQPVNEEAEEQDTIDLLRLRQELDRVTLPDGKAPTGKANSNNKPCLHDGTKRNAAGHQSDGKGCNHEASKRFSRNPPPMVEISQHQRRDSSGEQSVSPSVVSSLSGSTQMLLEYSLETGFKGKNSHWIAMVADIVKNLERAEQRKTETSARCLILLMDPLQRIFEIVQVPYIVESTTIGEMQARLPIVATDRRLARVRFCGFSCNGILFNAKMVPVQLVLDAQSSAKPIFAVPEGYNSEQIEVLGNSLLRSPHVAKLLHDKLAHSRRETGASKNSETKNEGSVPISQRHLGCSLGVIKED
jgi:hypothetical protein